MKKLASILLALVLMAALTMSCFAAELTPSAESKEAPAVSAQETADGRQAAAIIYDEDGNEVSGVPDGDLVITPYSWADMAEESIGNALKNAYSQIKNAETLDELVPGLETILQQYDSSINVSDLVVRDVFDVSIYGVYQDYLAEDGNTITIRFELKLQPDALLLVLHNYSGSEWEAIDDSRVVRNADGSVDVTFDSLSPIVFVVDGGAVVEIDPNVPTSPQTGETTSYGAMAAGVVCLAAVVLIALRRKHAAD